MLPDAIQVERVPSYGGGRVAGSPRNGRSATDLAERRLPQALERETEGLTRTYGRELFQRLQGARLPWRGRLHRWLQSLVLREFMGDEALRFSLLRFVDVFPTLTEKRQVAAHLRQYLEASARAGHRTLSWRAGWLLHLLRSGLVPDAITAEVSRRAITLMGKQFIAGRDPESTAPQLTDLEGRGCRFTLDLLGERVTSDREADAFARRYRTIIEDLPSRLEKKGGELVDSAGPRVNLSIKLSSLTHRFDPKDPKGTTERVLQRLRPLLWAAIRQGVFLNIDVEQYAYRDLTLEILARLLEEAPFQGYAHVGIVMQAYLVDAEETLDDWLQWTRERRQPMTIRLVKGAYWDSEQIWARQRNWPVPVHTDKRKTDAQFERMTYRLLRESDRVRTAVASHNVRSLAWAMALRERLGVAQDRFELQLLYGMAGALPAALVGMGYSPRIYVPIGELIPGMAYLVRRILENTSNDSFIRQFFYQGASPEELLTDPKGDYE